MSNKEEEFIHFVHSIQDLNNAWSILQKIRRSEGNPLVGPAFQFALIEYSKPYRISFGKNEGAKYRLDERHVAERHRGLHKRILRLRDKVYAHGDLSVLDARLYVSSTLGGQLATIGQNIIYGTELLSEVDVIIEMIEAELEQMYVVERELEAQLPPTDPR